MAYYLKLAMPILLASISCLSYASSENNKRISDFIFTDITESIPKNFKGDFEKLSHIRTEVAKFTSNKYLTETSSDYKKRKSVIKLGAAIPDFDFNRLYAIKIIPSPQIPGVKKDADYNADSELVTLKYGVWLIEGLCKDNLTKHRSEHPITCIVSNINNDTHIIAISNSNKLLKDRLIRKRPSLYNDDYVFVDNFKIPRERVRQLGDRYFGDGISTLFIGNVAKEQNNPYLSGEYALNGFLIPFELKYIVHYEENTGRIISKIKSK